MKEWLFGHVELVAKVVDFDPKIDENFDETEALEYFEKTKDANHQLRVAKCYRVDLFAKGKRIATLQQFGETKEPRLMHLFASRQEYERQRDANEYIKRLKPILTQR